MAPPALFPKHLKPIEPQGQVLLQNERSRATFNSNSLKETIYGKEYLAKRDQILKLLVNDPVLGDKSKRYFTGRTDRFKRAMASARQMAGLIK